YPVFKYEKLLIVTINGVASFACKGLKRFTISSCTIRLSKRSYSGKEIPIFLFSWNHLRLVRASGILVKNWAFLSNNPRKPYAPKTCINLINTYPLYWLVKRVLSIGFCKVSLAQSM